jgi:hypothetical protein
MIRRATLPTLLVLLVAGCAQQPQTPSQRASAAATAACRASTEASFDRQNRALLSERDTTGTPFSSSGNSGITTRGLTRQYDYDTQLSNCLAGTHETTADTDVPPAPTPAAARR